jgi:di/tricarboxylate transporter
MTHDQIILFSVFAGIMVLLFIDKLRYDLVAFGGLMAGVLSGVVPADKAFSGFGHPATIVVALVLVATAGLVRTGAVGMLTRWVARPERPVSLHIAVLGGLGAVMSAFMNNIAALAILMPIDLQVSARAKRAAGLTLMPLAFATILGGMITLIGTPPNLIAASFRQSVTGAGFSVFDFAPVGGMVALVGVLFVAFVGWRLIPLRPTKDSATSLRDYVAELVVAAGARAIGQTLFQLGETAAAGDITVLAVKRGGRRRLGPAKQLILAEGDVLLLEADPDALERFRADQKLAFPDGTAGESPLISGDGQVLVEVLVTAKSRIAHRTAHSIGLAWRQQSVLMGINRSGTTLHSNLRGTRVQPGDILLILMREDRREDVIDWLNAMPLDGGSRSVTREGQIWLALGLFAAGIGAAAFGFVTMPVALGLIIVGYVLGGVLNVEELYSNVDWPIVVLLGSMIPLGLALDSTGGSALIAAGLARASSGLPAWGALSVLMVAVMLLSDVLNNNVTTIIAAPVSVRLAEQLGVNPDAFLMGVAVAASCAFLTPIGHQNNTLILGPGGYRFGDYWRMGLALEVIVLLVAVPMILLVWPLGAVAP